MTRKHTSITFRWALAWSLLLTGCQPPAAVGPAAKPVSAATQSLEELGGRSALDQPVTPVEIPLPVVHGAPRLLVDTNGSGSLSGTVNLNVVTDPYFGNSAASYKLFAMPAGNALITLTTLEEDLLGKGGVALSSATDAQGHFSLQGNVPTDRPFVVNAYLAGGHRLSALVPMGTASVTLDETSTAIAEMARWQLASAPGADVTTGRKTLQDLATAQLADFNTRSAPLLSPDAFQSHGTVPSVDMLKSGNGLGLRNLYVQAFGTSVVKNATTAKDLLSDAWAALLGYRPLALTNVATEQPMKSPRDFVADHLGNLFIHDSGIVYYLPRVPRGPLWLCNTAMSPGHQYAILGWYPDFESRYQPTEQSSVNNPDLAPLIANGFPIPPPQKMLLERAGSTDESHFFFTYRTGHRLMLVPGQDFTRYGRTFKAGRLYTLAGTGQPTAWGNQVQGDDPNTPLDETEKQYLLGDGGPAYQAPLVYPMGFTKDSRGNLYVLDSGYFGVPYYSNDPNATETYPYVNARAANGLNMNVFHESIRLVRASDGLIFTLRLTKGGQPYPVQGAQDMRIHEGPDGNFLYVTDTFRHCVIRVPLPGDLAGLDTHIPSATEIQPVLGQSGKPGFIDLSLPGAKLPDFDNVGEGVPRAQVLLTNPLSIEFDADGNLVVADFGHMWLLKKADIAGGGKVYPLCGAFNTNFMEGDSRLVEVKPAYINLDPYNGDLLLAETFRNQPMALWTSRGSL